MHKKLEQESSIRSEGTYRVSGLFDKIKVNKYPSKSPPPNPVSTQTLQGHAYGDRMISRQRTEMIVAHVDIFFFPFTVNFFTIFFLGDWEIWGWAFKLGHAVQLSTHRLERDPYVMQSLLTFPSSFSVAVLKVILSPREPSLVICWLCTATHFQWRETKQPRKLLQKRCTFYIFPVKITLILKKQNKSKTKIT